MSQLHQIKHADEDFKIVESAGNKVNGLQSKFSVSKPRGCLPRAELHYGLLQHELSCCLGLKIKSVNHPVNDA